MINFFLAIVCGIAGGALNCILFHKGFVFPSWENIDGKKILDLGYISNLILGGGAGIIIYGFGACEFDLFKMVSICFLSGIGGGSFIVSVLQNKQLNLQQYKIESLHKISKKLINDKRTPKSRKSKKP